MKNSQSVLVFAAIAALAAGIGCGSGEDDAAGGSGTAQVVTASAVQDVLNANCMPCHASGEPQEELALDSIEGLMQGSEHGAMVVPGDAAESEIVKSLRGDGKERMPFMKDPLSESDIKLIEDWINAGAQTS